MKSCTLKETLRSVAILFVLIMGFHQIQAQSNEERAKAYYFQAEEAFTEKEYDKAINYCDQVVEILGSSNALVETLYVKSYYAQNKIAKAKEALNSFSNFRLDDASLSREIAPYIVKIEEAEKEEKRRQELAAKKAEEKAEYDRTHTDCRSCYGRGKVGFKKDCSYCNGGRIDCSKTCSMCKGKRRSYHGSAVGYVNCGFCKGSGKTKLTCPCNDCDGFGNVWDAKTCPECNGKGDVLKSW